MTENPFYESAGHHRSVDSLNMNVFKICQTKKAASTELSESGQIRDGVDGAPSLWNSDTDTMFATLRPQEIPLDHSESCNMFMPTADKPFVATPAAIELYGRETILACLTILQDSAIANAGLDYLQVFDDPTKGEKLWFIEDGAGGAITALLPTDY